MWIFALAPLYQNKEAPRGKAAFTRSQCAFEHGADAAITQKDTLEVPYSLFSSNYQLIHVTHY